MTWTNLDGYDDVMYSDLITTACSKTTPVKSFQFRHALAWIYYKVKASVASTVKVYDIKVNNVSLNGTAKFNFAAVSTLTGKSGSTVTWSPSTVTPQVSVKNGDLNSATVGTGGQAVTATDYEAWGNGLLVPTQGEKAFTIYYTITNDGTESAMMQYNYTPASAITWTDGQKYIYNIYIGLNEIKVNGTVETFDNGGTTSVTI